MKVIFLPAKILDITIIGLEEPGLVKMAHIEEISSGLKVIHLSKQEMANLLNAFVSQLIGTTVSIGCGWDTLDTRPVPTLHIDKEGCRYVFNLNKD